HDDEHPSLSINISKNAWMCGPCGAKGTAWQLAAFLSGVLPSDKPAVLAWLNQHELVPGNGGTRGKNSKESRIVARYPYEDEYGNVLFEVVRYEPKDFRQCKPDGTWNLNGTRRVLYRLPELRQAETVHIVEGEKDVESLRVIELAATCNAG